MNLFLDNSNVFWYNFLAKYLFDMQRDISGRSVGLRWCQTLVKFRAWLCWIYWNWAKEWCRVDLPTSSPVLYTTQHAAHWSMQRQYRFEQFLRMGNCQIFFHELQLQLLLIAVTKLILWKQKVRCITRFNTGNLCFKSRNP